MRVTAFLLAAMAAVASAQSNLFWHNEVTGASSDERPECLPYPDSKTKRSYWIVDGVASWVAPTEYSWRAINTTEKPPRTFYENYKTNETQWEKPASLAWVLMDREKPFYFNSVSNQTTRITPSEVGFHDQDRNATYYKIGNDTTWDPPAEASWHKAFDSKRNRTYFFNPVTKESVWVVPEKSNLAWSKWFDSVPDPVKWDL